MVRQEALLLAGKESRLRFPRLAQCHQSYQQFCHFFSPGSLEIAGDGFGSNRPGSGR